LISLGLSLITEHHFKSNLDDLARKVALRFAKSSHGMTDWKNPRLGAKCWFWCALSAKTQAPKSPGPIQEFLAVRRFGRSDRSAPCSGL
jgi:hypothetical protein